MPGRGKRQEISQTSIDEREILPRKKVSTGEFLRRIGDPEKTTQRKGKMLHDARRNYPQYSEI